MLVPDLPIAYRREKVTLYVWASIGTCAALLVAYMTSIEPHLALPTSVVEAARQACADQSKGCAEVTPVWYPNMKRHEGAIYAVGLQVHYRGSATERLAATQAIEASAAAAPGKVLVSARPPEGGRP